MVTGNYKKGVSLAEEAVNEIIKDLEHRKDIKKVLDKIPAEKKRRIKIKWCAIVQSKMDWIRVWG